MTLNSRRLQPLLEVADQREQQAAKKLADSEQNLKAAQDRLAELRGYLADYLAQPVPVSRSLIINRMQFINRLREAERYQQKAVEQARAQQQRQLQGWLDRRGDGARLAHLDSLCQQQESREESRREQKRMDEYASRLGGAAPALAAA